MSWVKIDDQFPYHRKVIAAGLEGRALYITALCYTAHQLTDGFIPAAVMPVLGVLSGVADVKQTASKLLDVCLWDACDNGYMIHDYLDYNPTKEEVIKTREARKDAGSYGGTRSAEAKRQAKLKQSAKQNSSKSQPRTRTPIALSSKEDREQTKLALLIKDVSADLQSALDKAYQSLGRKTPIYFKNEQQRDAYIEALKKLNGQSRQLIDKGISRERTSLSALLAWLETCVKNLNSHSQQGSNNGTHQGRIEEPYTAEELARAERINARRASKAAGLS